MLCPDVQLIGKVDPPFKDSEKRWICGDPKNHPWSEIPRNQAEFHIKTFMQDRAHFQVKTRVVDQVLVVDLGPETRVQDIQVNGAPPEFTFEIRRGFLGQALTPKLLSQNEQWVLQELETLGYPCSEVKSVADVERGVVTFTVSLHSGARDSDGQIRPFKISGITENPIPEMDASMLRRYDAFDVGKIYNGDKTNLTARRIVSQGMVESVNFTAACKKDGTVQLEQTAVAGPPRLLTFGLGVDTEGLILGKASWKNTRLGRSASLFDVTALASIREQVINSTLTWYNLPYPSRRYYKPVIEFRHQNEAPFEIITSRVQFSPATSYDSDWYGLSLRAGPSANLVRTIRGAGPPNSKFLSLEAEVRLLSHYFEFYRNSPRTGINTSILASFNRESWLSDVSATRLSWYFEGLLNLKNYIPPLIVFGLRSQLTATITPEDVTNTKLPTNFRDFLGGSSNLRGFGRTEISNQGLGGLSSYYLGLEARLAGGLPFGLQPFVFDDFGVLGLSAFHFDLPVYTSPGIGLRYESPFGVFRTTFAHGFAIGPQAEELKNQGLLHWQFFFSFGEEF